jgi:hypothetical protein
MEKLRRLRWTGHVARIGSQIHAEYWLRYLLEGGYWEDREVNKNITLRRIVE